MAKVIATLEIKNAAKMAEEGRKEVADWLRRQAKNLLRKVKTMVSISRLLIILKRR